MNQLTPAIQQYILHWGEMGTRWGINRTVSQIHALLYLSPKPLPADEIARILNVARSNVSSSLKELLSWGIIKAVPLMGERRTHYESLPDVWQMFQIVFNERRRREVDPTLAMLKELVVTLNKEDPKDSYTLKKVEEILEFFEFTTKWFDELRDMTPEKMKRMMKLGGTMSKFL